MVLEPGQYQIGDFVFGNKTLFRVEAFDVAGYDVNVQDFQAAISDEMRFGMDSLKPLPIQITINAFVNRLLPNAVAISPIGGDLDFTDDPTVGHFANEWRSDLTRKAWGELRPLYCCREDGSVVSIYGRPGKLSVSKRPINGSYHKIVAEFRRSDTLAYSNFEWYLHCRPLEIVRVGRADQMGMGDAPCWLRFLIVGPANHPIIQFGDLEIDLNVNINAGDVVEISSYPWQRRVISLPEGITYSSRLNSPFLDQIYFPPNAAFEVSWNASGTNSSSETILFTNYSAGALPSADWDVVYNPSGAGGTIEADGTNCVWNDSGNSTKLGAARYKLEQTLTDYQLVGISIASPSELSIISEECVDRIIGRAKSDLSEYTYCDVSLTHCWWGVHKNGVDIKISPKFDIPLIYLFFADLFGDTVEGDIPGDDWEYECEFGQGGAPRSYVLRINKRTVARFTESPSASTPYSSYGSNYRWTGFGMRATAGLIGQHTPGPLSKWHMRDNPPPSIASQIDVSQMYVLWRDAWNVP